MTPRKTHQEKQPMNEKQLCELEHCRDAAKEAVHMLEENAKGFPAHYLDYPAYQEIIDYARQRVDHYNNALLR